MTANKHVTIYCDHDGCGRRISLPDESAYGPARRTAREEGWRYVGMESKRRGFDGRDYCPDHAGDEA